MKYIAENFWMYIFFGVAGIIVGILVGRAKENHKWVKKVYLKIQEMKDEKAGSTHPAQYDMLNAIIIQLKKLL